MLAVGVAVGAAIGPAPSASFAVGQLLPLLPSLTGAGAKARTSAVQPPAVASQATPAPTSGSGAAASAPTSTPSTNTATSTATTPTPSSESAAPTSTTPKSKSKAAPLPPVTHVWLIELAGSTFAEAAAQPAAAPYIDTHAVPTGTLLSGWSALDASAFASEAALLAEPAPQLLDTIVQPPCPEGAAAAQCAADTPGGLTAADGFLTASLPTITSTAAYRENGLVVVTFASVASASATGLPAGASSATLTSQPPSGVLLISPFAAAGAKSSTAFNPASPKQSLEKLLRR